MPDDEKITIDARGFLCPQPVVMSREAYDNAVDGARLRTIVDTPVQAENVRRAIEKVGGTAVVTEADDHFVIDIAKSAPRECAITEPAAKELGKPHVVYIASDKMGEGPDDLGGILIKAFINTIRDIKPLPSHIIFLNSGVLITSTEGPLIDSLKELESMGVTILSCGTCLNFFERAEQLKVGIISNMFDILDTLTNASGVVAP